MAIKRGQITKKQVKDLQKSMDDFEANISARRLLLKPEFQKWVTDEISEMRKRIDEQDFWVTLNANAKHLQRTFLRMESGEILSLTPTGGFNIRRD